MVRRRSTTKSRALASDASVTAFEASSVAGISGVVEAVAGVEMISEGSETLDALDRLLEVLPGAALVIGADGRVVRASAAASALGLVGGDRLTLNKLTGLVNAARRDGKVHEESFSVRRPPLGKGLLDLRARVASMSGPSPQATVLVLVEDLGEAKRLESVRRDFVANVSHELKTPVGALSLLAEAVQSASDDPEAVRRFAARMQIEAQRLSNLVNDVIDLSRLQDGPSPDESVPVPIAHVVAEAVDSTRLAATAKDIEIVTSVEAGLTVLGAEAQLATALRNLLVNAVLYSDSNTRVAVVARSVQSEQGAHLVEISVKDQGVGIPVTDLPRVFERFYRVDPARSRGTGGTGLGLAIVKHVATNHGGECLVWSLEGEGATFTLRLPSYEALHSDHVHAQFGELHEMDELAEPNELAAVVDNQSTTANQDLSDPIESALQESPTEEMHP